MDPRHRIAIGLLTLSAAGFVGIVQREGYSDGVIIPTKGDVPTIGFGTTEGVKMGDRTTPVAAMVRALQDSQKYEGALKRCVRAPLHQVEYDAYIHHAYNIGSGAFCSSTLVRKLNAGDYRGACDQKKGAIRKAMFAKMRTARHMKVQVTGEGVAVGFLGRTARIALVHQEGREDAVEAGGPRYRYAERRLLGFTQSEREQIHDRILCFLQE